MAPVLTTAVRLEDGATLTVSVSGQGRDLLLLSGLGGTAAFWSPVLPQLTSRFRVIRYDQRGIGASTRGTDHVDIARLSLDTLAVLAHVEAKEAILLGHSTGGAILQDLALRDGSRASGLVLSATWARPNRFMRELFQSRLEVLRAAPVEYAAMVAFLGYPPDYLDANWAAYENMRAGAPVSEVQQTVVAERIAALLAFDRSGEIRRIRLPTLIQGAEDDLIVPAFLQRELAGLMPHSTLGMLPSGGHFFPVSRADAFCDQLLRWVQALA